MTDFAFPQCSLFDFHARHTDPDSSHRLVESLGRNTTLRYRIMSAALALHEMGQDTFTDGDLLEFIEADCGVRQQRNIIARSRGIMETDGLIERATTPDPITGLLRFSVPGDRVAMAAALRDAYEDATVAGAA